MSTVVTLEPEWAIGAMFGGRIAERAVALARSVLDGPARVPLATSVRFLRPLEPGPAPVAATVRHPGRRAATVAVTFGDRGGRPAAEVLVTLGDPAALGPASAPSDDEPALPASASAPGDLGAQVDWRAAVDPWSGGGPGDFRAWIRARRARPFRTRDGDVLDPAWYPVAADLLGPALAWTGRPLPFRVATVALDVTTTGLTRGTWLGQQIAVVRDGDLAVARLDLRDAAGATVATATQTAVVLPARPDEIPVAVTGFGWGRPVRHEFTNDRPELTSGGRDA